MPNILVTVEGAYVFLTVLKSCHICTHRVRISKMIRKCRHHHPGVGVCCTWTHRQKRWLKAALTSAVMTICFECFMGLRAQTIVILLIIVFAFIEQEVRSVAFAISRKVFLIHSSIGRKQFSLLKIKLLNLVHVR